MGFLSPFLVGIVTGSVGTWGISQFRQRRRARPLSKQWVPTQNHPSQANQEQADGSGDTRDAVDDADEEPGAVSPAQEGAPPAPATLADTARDQLEQIKGIGQTYARRLNAAGIMTFADLADLTPGRVREIVTSEDASGVSEQLIQEWIAQARDLAGKGGQQA